MRSTPSPPSLSPLDRALLGVIAVLGLAVRVWLISRNAGLTMDSPLYVRMAEALASRDPALGPAHHGYPALVAVAGWLVPGREWPGRAVSLLMGMLLIPLVFAMARRVAGARWALLAAGLVAVHPLLAVFSGPIMTESTFLLVAMLAVHAMQLGRPGFAGAWLGLGYVVRPEALVLALGVAVLGGRGWRGALLVALGFLAIAAPYLGYLRFERGAWTLTPKEALVRPAFENRRDAEWRVGDPARDADERPRSLIERVRWAAPSIAATYLPRLGGHAARCLEAWPPPLLLISLVGLARVRGPLLAPLLILLVLPLLATAFELRFTQLYVPSLAVFAAAAAAWISMRWSRLQRWASVAVLVLATGGVAWCWIGPAGERARWFDDGPMEQLRAAGKWLAERGSPADTVMDRKSYVAFYAGMTHVQLPDDELDTIIEHARAVGADYLVVEEYVAMSLRPQLKPLLHDRAFRDRERRLQPLFAIRDRPSTGVAVFAVVRER